MARMIDAVQVLHNIKFTTTNTNMIDKITNFQKEIKIKFRRKTK